MNARGLSELARARVRARVGLFMTTPVRIKRGHLGTLDPATGLVTGITASTTIFCGSARVHTITGQGSVVAGDGEFDTRQVIVSIPWDAPSVNRDDLVLVGNDTEADPELPSEVYRVMEVAGGSLFGDARRLSCVGWHPNRYWGEQ